MQQWNNHEHNTTFVALLTATAEPRQVVFFHMYKYLCFSVNVTCDITALGQWFFQDAMSESIFILVQECLMSSEIV